MRSKIWDSFLRINDPSTATRPQLNPEWLAAQGVSSGAPIVLHHLRNDVLPLIRDLEKTNKLSWYMFLIHDCSSGVPTTADDKNAYIHLRTVFTETARAPDISKWIMFKPMASAPDVDGFYPRFIGYQSELILRFIEKMMTDNDELSAIRQLRQFLHYFSNMTQMKVS